MKPDWQSSRPPGFPGRRFRVGVRLPGWTTGYGLRIFEGLAEFQRRDGKLELHFDQPSGGDLPPEVIDKNWHGDGLIVFRYRAGEAASWRERGIPVVNISTEFPGATPVFPRVTVDNRQVGRAGAEHLAALGLRDFAYVHESTRRYSKERLDAFREAVERLGGRCHVIKSPASSFPIPVRPEMVERGLLGPLSKLPRPCGVLAKDDIAAVSTMRAMKKLGIACPEEMPLLGISDDIVFCHMMDPEISSIPFPGARLGYQAAVLLGRMMSGEEIPGDFRIEVEPGPVMSRESTGRVVLSDELVTRALDHLRGKIHRRVVKVSELAAQVGVSKELLRQRFQAALGRSPKQEIERLRGRHVSERLRNSDLTLEALAEECGFAGGAEVCRFVKRLTGKTPGEIRRG
ncbi:substrate-binding domain-containing protein [Luteolibacter marinus]|uniref:AraC family transcriptional regulator n=1 Tax=Luteolibacter marinus TaxID=2776705 RepID=UPI00186885E9|nr:substrate-binding domain-containing protein [Luteolibacter marinus]